MDIKIVHRRQLVSPRQVVHKIRALPMVCRTQPFLHCVTEHDEIHVLCKKFAEVWEEPRVVDPDEFCSHVCISLGNAWSECTFEDGGILDDEHVDLRIDF